MSVGSNKIKQVGNIYPTKTRKNPNNGRVYNPNGIAPTLNSKTGGNLEPFIITKNKDKDEQIPTIDKTGFTIRKLTPRECWRLMGFSDSDFDKAKSVNSNTQLYKQAGNSIVVNVLEELFKNLLLKGSTNQ